MSPFPKKSRSKRRDSPQVSTTLARTYAGAVGDAEGYAETVLDDRPLGFWRFGEHSGTEAADASGNGNAGRYVGEVGLGAASLVVGDDAAIDLNGSDAGVVLPDSDTLRPATAVSVEAWVRPNTVPSDSDSGWNLVTKWKSFLLYLQGGTDARFVFALHDPSTARYLPAVRSATTVAPGNTYHVAGTYDGVDLRIFVDGTLEGTEARPGRVNDAEGSGAIAPGGWGALPSPRFNGSIDEVAIYGRALSAPRVRAHYIEGSPV
jgi:Concanavalin A-like lectin/glucanases superfamily